MINPLSWFEAFKYYALGYERIIDWDKRVELLGPLSVIDNTHAPEEYDYVTKRQKEIIYPLFKSELDGSEKILLDFGCGSGRFTGDLACMISGNAIGVDPTEGLIKICPPHDNVNYFCNSNFFDLNEKEFDIIWICLVFGSIPNSTLDSLAQKIEESLKPGGLLFLVENTGPKYIDGPWRIRTRAQIFSLFPSIYLKNIGVYNDAGQEISILSGRSMH